MTVVESLVGDFLPWLGGLAGLTILYFVLMVYFRYEELQRIKHIEELLLLRGKE